MWCQAGFDPERFWEQTPLHFRLVMRGVRKRLTAEVDVRLRQAWWTGAFAGLTQSKGGLKPLEHYVKRNDQVQRRSAADLHDVFQSMKAHGAPITIRKVQRRKRTKQEKAHA